MRRLITGAVTGAVLTVLAGAVPVAAQGSRVEGGPVFSRSASIIGVAVRDVRSSDLQAAKLSAPEGVFIEDVRSGAPAEKAGMKAGDIVLEYDGERVRSARQFTRLVQESSVGRVVSVTVNRAGTRHTLSVTPEEGRVSGVDVQDLGERVERRLRELPEWFEMPAPRGQASRLGVTLQPLSSQLAAFFGVSSGALVASVEPGSAAARAGVKAGDVVTAVNGNAVSSPAEVAARLRDIAPSGAFRLTVTRDRKETVLQGTLSADRSRPQRDTVGI